MGKKIELNVAGRMLHLSNLEKILYLEAGFTKAQVLDYYIRIAPVLLPHLKNRLLCEPVLSLRQRLPAVKFLA